MGSTIEEQTEKTLANVRAVLEATGATLDDVVKATVHLADLAEFSRFNAEYSRMFQPPYPARTAVGRELLGIQVEIDVIRTAGGEAVPAVGDVADAEDAQGLVRTAMDAYSRLDILFNNAGVSCVGELHETPDESGTG